MARPLRIEYEKAFYHIVPGFFWDRSPNKSGNVPRYVLSSNPIHLNNFTYFYKTIASSIEKR